MLERDAAERIHRVQDAHANWYLVEDGTRLTVVDTGFRALGLPSSVPSTSRGDRSGTSTRWMLTRGHFDHMGFARRAQQQLGVTVLVHEREVGVAVHPWRYDHERARPP